MRIAILDDYQNCVKDLKAFELLENHQVQILTKHHNSPIELSKVLDSPDALVLNRTRTKITKELLDLLPTLKVISQTGKNSGHIDATQCKEKNITILEGQGNPISTAELTWSLIMSGLRKMPQAIKSMQEGNWQTNIGSCVNGTMIGIWGYGKIGKRIAQYAKAFGAEVMVFGSENSQKESIKDGFLAADSRDTFFSSCDVITLHLRLVDNTKEIVRLDDLLKMKANALIVNTARAGLIEKDALLKALKQGRPGFAALDVYDEEPIFNSGHPLLTMDNVICTPHLGYVEFANYENYFRQAFSNLLIWSKEQV